MLSILRLLNNISILRLTRSMKIDHVLHNNIIIRQILSRNFILTNIHDIKVIVKGTSFFQLITQISSFIPVHDFLQAFPIPTHS